MRITYLGHSCFEIQIKDKKILVDPFLVMSPSYDFRDVTDIFVSHGHSDHLGSAIEISKQTGAKITAIFELANYCAQKGASVNGVNIGGKVEFEWGNVNIVPAFHSSSTPEGFYAGIPCGFVFEIGDTSLNSEMKIIGELYEPDIVMLPIGGFYTMDIEQAVIASEWLSASVVIPMHYNTFDAIKVVVLDFERQIREKGKIPLVLKIGQSLE